MNHKSISLLCFRCLALAGLILPTYSSLSSLGDPAGLGSRSLPATPPRHEASKVLRRREAVDPLVDQRIRFSDSVETAISGLEKGGQLLVHARVESQDVVILQRNTTSENITVQSEVYSTFMVLSHLPVTAISILLPELPEDGSSLSSNFRNSTAYKNLTAFRTSLLALDVNQILNNDPAMISTSQAIIRQVTDFVNRTLSRPESVSYDSVKQFTDRLQPELEEAAEYAVEDYYRILDNIVDLSVSDPSEWSVVIAVQGFSYRGSFLFKYYEQLLRSSGDNSYSSERIAFLPQPSCSTSSSNNMPLTTSYRAVLANTTYIHTLNRLFNKCRFTPLHSLLSDAASEVLGSQESPVPPDCSPPISFVGFDTFAERFYVVLIATLLSVAVIFAVMVASMCYEDRCIKREAKSTTMKVTKSTAESGPSLIAPIAERELTKSYSAYHQLKKKRSQHQIKTPSSPKERPNGGVRYVRMSSDPSSPLLSNDSLATANSPAHAAAAASNGNTVTRTEISLADLAMSASYEQL